MTTEELLDRHGLCDRCAVDLLVQFFGHEWAEEILSEHIDDMGLVECLTEFVEATLASALQDAGCCDSDARDERDEGETADMTQDLEETDG
jgi:hypothetical protein